MAQKYHGDGDVDGLLRKISNACITNVDEHKVCYLRKEMKGPRVMSARRRYIMLMGAILLYRNRSRPFPCSTFPLILDSCHLILINANGFA
jgi:hypothetical protein